MKHVAATAVGGRRRVVKIAAIPAALALVGSMAVGLAGPAYAAPAAASTSGIQAKDVPNSIPADSEIQTYGLGESPMAWPGGDESLTEVRAQDGSNNPTSVKVLRVTAEHPLNQDGSLNEYSVSTKVPAGAFKQGFLDFSAQIRGVGSTPVTVTATIPEEGQGLPDRELFTEDFTIGTAFAAAPFTGSFEVPMYAIEKNKDITLKFEAEKSIGGVAPFQDYFELKDVSLKQQLLTKWDTTVQDPASAGANTITIGATAPDQPIDLETLLTGGVDPTQSVTATGTADGVGGVTDFDLRYGIDYKVVDVNGFDSTKVGNYEVNYVLNYPYEVDENGAVVSADLKDKTTFIFHVKVVRGDIYKIEPASNFKTDYAWGDWHDRRDALKDIINPDDVDIQVWYRGEDKPVQLRSDQYVASLDAGTFATTTDPTTWTNVVTKSIDDPARPDLAGKGKAGWQNVYVGISDKTVNVPDANTHTLLPITEVPIYLHPKAITSERYNVPGGDRYSTSADLIAKKFSSNPADPQDLFVVTGEKFPDGLAVAPAAAADGMTALVKPNEVPQALVAALKGKAVAHTFVIGGGISEETQAELAALTGNKVEVIGGKDRIDTALAIAKRFFPDATTVTLATSQDFPDALALSSLAVDKDAPILLTDGKAAGLDPRVADYLKPKVDAWGHVTHAVGQAYIAGFSGAISDRVKADVGKALGDGGSVVRIGGKTRYLTAIAIAKEVKGAGHNLSDPRNQSVSIVTGKNFADALSLAPLAGVAGAPLFLTERADCLPAEVGAALHAKGDFPHDHRLSAGGNGVVSDAVINDLTVCQ